MNADISRDKDVVCEHMQCVEASLSLLSVGSGQHKSDMTFPQDVEMQEMGVMAGGL